MKKITRFSVAVLAVITMTNCKKSEETTGKSNSNIEKLTADYFDDKNKLNPLEATVNGVPGYNDQLVFEMTDGFRAEEKAFYEKYQKALKSLDYDSLTDDEKISFSIIDWETQRGLEQLEFPSNLIPVNQFHGVYLTMGQFAGAESSQPFKTPKDYRDFLSRTEKFVTWIDSAMVYMKKGIDKKITLPKALTEKTIPQFEGLISEKPEDNIFYSAIKKFPQEFSKEEKDFLTEAYARIIQDKLNPKLKEMVAFLKKDYLPASRTSSGVTGLPFGKDMYKALAKASTTTDMTPDEIHELGLKEVARLRSEMQKVMDQVGFKGSIQEFCEHVRNKKELMPFKSPEEVIANFERIHNKIKPNVDKLFGIKPTIPFEIRRTEAFREKSASAEYTPGAPDGSRPGIFYVPIPDVTKYNMYADEDLFLHEAIPGHHFQIAIQQENKALPAFRQNLWINAPGEGWALYTERLGKELGLYDDPYQYFGMLSGEMLRATRLVVDTGLHWKGWTREQVIQYKMENEAEPADGIVMEAERYMAIPGQALGYKIGQLKILDLRAKAEKELGSKFDIKEFHREVLESGLMPLSVLENKIDRWIAKVKK